MPIIVSRIFIWAEILLWAEKFGGLKFFHGPKMLGGGGQHFYGAKTLNWGPENILVEKSVLPKNIFEQFRAQILFVILS